MGQKRTTPQIPLKQHTPLRAKKGINKMSDKAKDELKIWLKVMAERIRQLQEKFGYLPCENCKKTIGGMPEAHHNNHNRRDCSFSNCRITDAYCNRIVIEDNNIKDVPSLL